MRFVVEWIAPQGEYLLARQLDDGAFEFAGARLGGRLVRAVSMPRALDAAGKPRTDLWAFAMSTRGVSVGEVLELTHDDSVE